MKKFTKPKSTRAKTRPRPWIVRREHNPALERELARIRVVPYNALLPVA